MAGRIDIWKDDNRSLSSYEVRYFDSKGKLREVVRASVFVLEKLYGVGTIYFGKGSVNLEFPEASTDMLAAQKNAYEKARNSAQRLALDHKVSEIDDATAFGIWDEKLLKRHRKP